MAKKVKGATALDITSTQSLAADPNKVETYSVSAGGATQVRVTFTSGEVGNGDGNDGAAVATPDATLAYGGQKDGGLAVRVQAEDANDALTGPLSRANDEGILFVTGSKTTTFDVRDLISGASRGDDFEAVFLGTNSADSFNAKSARLDKSYNYVNTGAGDDVLTGGTEEDFFVGGNGNDTLNGGFEVDTLVGGAGNDVFVFDSVSGKAGKDILGVTGVNLFTVGQDKIGLDANTFKKVDADKDGAFDATAFGTLITYNSTTGDLTFDKNGASKAGGEVVLANLVGAPAITAADFILV
jgi:Ca2+-binding RTX toxin-like protein